MRFADSHSDNVALVTSRFVNEFRRFMEATMITNVYLGNLGHMPEICGETGAVIWGRRIMCISGANGKPGTNKGASQRAGLIQSMPVDGTGSVVLSKPRSRYIA